MSYPGMHIHQPLTKLQHLGLCSTLPLSHTP